MQIVIDIDADIFERIKRQKRVGVEGSVCLVDEAYAAISNGTPLPKGHGRLIDADALRTSFRESIDECDKWANEVDPDTMMYARISQSVGTFVEASLRTEAQPTLVEADKEADDDTRD